MALTLRALSFEAEVVVVVMVAGVDLKFVLVQEQHSRSEFS
jgi:hypothetical protein